MIRLDLGSGPYPAEGFVTVDLDRERAHPDVVADLTALPFADGSVLSVRAVHVLEHLGKHDARRALGEIARVLHPEHGHGYLEVPDLQYVLETALGKVDWYDGLPPNEWFLDLVFGNQEGPGEYHRTGWTAETFERDIRAAGLGGGIGSTWSHEQRSLCTEVYRA